jgi:cysteine desulfurase/selenocysteine lyase
VGAGSLERADVEDGTADLWQTGRRFEFGTRASALLAGLGASLDWLNALGWANIERHIAGMSSYLKARILERPFLQLLTPIPFAESSGLTTFSMHGWQAGEVSSLLRQKGRIHVRVIPHYNAIRISTPCFCQEQDIDALVAALEDIYAQPPKGDD